MVAPLDITGERYGRLVAIERAAPSSGKRPRTRWLFQCDCGSRVTLGLEGVRGGTSRSCGCLRRDRTRDRSVTHGHSVGRKVSRTLKSYYHAKSRCFNSGDPKYPLYGGRGITMCEEWRDDFSAFIRDMGECPTGKTLDRINPHGNYEPGNCRWASSRQQARTRTDNVFVEHDGRRMILKDFAAMMGVEYKGLHARIKYKGQQPHEAVEAMRKSRRSMATSSG